MDQAPANFAGKFYELNDANLLPKPSLGRPPVLIGGIGEKRTLRLVAEHADEWCSESISVERYAHKTEVLLRHCEAVGRDPATIRRSMSVAGNVVPTTKAVARRA